jgi:hypothetical protein
MPVKKRLLKERIVDDSNRTKSQLMFDWVDDLKARRQRGDLSHHTTENLMQAAKCRDELAAAEELYKDCQNETTRTELLTARSNYQAAERLHRQAVGFHREIFDKINKAKQ